MHDTFDVAKVEPASFHLEHESLQLFRWYIKDHEEPKWKDCFQLLLQLFGPSSFDEFTRELTKLLQTGTLREYQREFEKLGNHIEGLSDGFYGIFFISVIKDVI